MILVTRPAPDGLALCHTLHQHGYETLWLPTLAFTPPDDRSVYEKMLPLLDTYDWLIFISREAVRQALPHFPNTLPTRCRIAAIGKATANALSAQGYTVAVCPDQGASAHSLLLLPVFQQMSGQRVAILKGHGGRQEPARTLSRRGADVTEMIVYRRICPLPDNLADCRTALLNNQIRAVLITSGEGLINLLRLTGDPCRHALQKIPLIVISARLERLATRLGFVHIHLAANPKEDAMITALHTLYRSGTSP